MLNWNVDEKKFREEDPEGYRLWRLTQLINYGLDGEKLDREEVKKVETFSLPAKELLLILKQLAYKDRRLSAKGEKDRLDILSLLTKTDIDFSEYKKL